MNDVNNFKGYCIKNIGGEPTTMPPVNLNSLEEAVNYVMLHKRIFEEVIIEDEDEFVILHAKDHVIVFPEQFAGR